MNSTMKKTPSTSQRNAGARSTRARGSASGKLEMPEAVRKEYNEMLAWINDSMVTESLLYDLDRLPEQLEEGSREWREMLIIVQHMKAAHDEGKASSPNTKVSESAP